MKRLLIPALLVSLFAACAKEQGPAAEDNKAPEAVALHIGDKVDKGVVIYVDPVDSTAGKILELGYEPELTWSDLGERVNSFSASDGVANTALIRASKHYPENYPALMHCDDLGEGWYLPAIDELKSLYALWNGSSASAVNQAARDQFDALLAKVGAAPINPDGETTANGQSYWSSTEAENTNANAYYVRMGVYAAAAATKRSTNRLTRCFKVVGTLTPAPELELDSRNFVLEATVGALAKTRYISNKDVKAEIVTEGADSWLSVTVTKQNILFSALSDNSGDKERMATVRIVAGTDTYFTSMNVIVVQNPLVVRKSYLLNVMQGGIVFWQDPDPQSEKSTDVKIISLSRLKGKAWCETAVQDVPTGAMSDEDGEANTKAILSLEQASQFHAANYCKDMGEGWYLPAKNELLALFCTYDGVKDYDAATRAVPDAITDAEKAARAKFESILAENGGDVFNSMAGTANGDSYWSSTEFADDVQKAYYLRVGLLDCSGMAKRGTARYVRCAKKITVTE